LRVATENLVIADKLDIIVIFILEYDIFAQNTIKPSDPMILLNQIFHFFASNLIDHLEVSSLINRSLHILIF